MKNENNTLFLPEKTLELLKKQLVDFPSTDFMGTIGFFGGISVVALPEGVLKDDEAYIVNTDIFKYPQRDLAYYKPEKDAYSLYRSMLRMYNIQKNPQKEIIKLFNPFKKWWKQIKTHFREGWDIYIESLKE